ncbi:MAG: mannose-1-phosphate guanylyltransferase/mannose-6-phosphate isomerase [Pseudobdellovibrio sp.]
MKLIPIVLSGGSGTRLWPISRVMYPKQFSQLLEESLQSLTLSRLQRYEPTIIVTSENLINLTEKEIFKNKSIIRKVIYEPEAKNTGPAVAVVCRYLELLGLQDQIAGVFSSDALITDEVSFQHALQAAYLSAQSGQVVTLGIRPDRVETGFGYIQVKKESKLNQVTEVLKFHEKPNYQQAEKFISEGNYFWNAGIFIFQISKMIGHFKMHQPEVWAVVSELTGDLKNIKTIYSKLNKISFDYAIIEKLNTSALSCVPCDIGWSDLGSWDVLDQMSTLDPKKISIAQKPYEIDSTKNSVFSNEKKTYGLVGVDDLIIVDTADALMICKKGESQKVKDLVDIIKIDQIKITEEHVFENRPWGQFEVLNDEKHFKSKIIKVDSGQKISYQSHAQRAEHWVIVQGEATVILNDKEHDLKTGDHIFIPQGAKHRIHNKSAGIVEFIEVQVGSYFGEDDITRYQDDYGRE